MADAGPLSAVVPRHQAAALTDTAGGTSCAAVLMPRQGAALCLTSLIHSSHRLGNNLRLPVRGRGLLEPAAAGHGCQPRG